MWMTVNAWRRWWAACRRGWRWSTATRSSNVSPGIVDGRSGCVYGRSVSRTAKEGPIKWALVELLLLILLTSVCKASRVWSGRWRDRKSLWLLLEVASQCWGVLLKKGRGWCSWLGQRISASLIISGSWYCCLGSSNDGNKSSQSCSATVVVSRSRRGRLKWSLMHFNCSYVNKSR